MFDPMMLFGHGFVIALLAFIAWRGALRWRTLAAAYGRDWREPMETRGLQNGVLQGLHLGATSSYNGILTIGVSGEGVALKVFAPFALFHRPLFIPWGDIQGFKQDWFIDGKSAELEFRRAPRVRLILSAEQAAWLAQASAGRMPVPSRMSPRAGTVGAWRAFVVGNLAVGVIVAVMVLGGAVLGLLQA